MEITENVRRMERLTDEEVRELSTEELNKLCNEPLPRGYQPSPKGPVEKELARRREENLRRCRRRALARPEVEAQERFVGNGAGGSDRDGETFFLRGQKVHEESEHSQRRMHHTPDSATVTFWRILSCAEDAEDFRAGRKAWNSSSRELAEWLAERE